MTTNQETKTPYGDTLDYLRENNRQAWEAWLMFRAHTTDTPSEHLTQLINALVYTRNVNRIQEEEAMVQ